MEVRQQATRVRVCNSIKFETGWNLPPVLKIVTLLHILHRHKPLLLSTWPSVLFLVQFNNFDRTTRFYLSYTLLLKPPVLMCSCQQPPGIEPRDWLEPPVLWPLRQFSFILHFCVLVRFLFSCIEECVWELVLRKSANTFTVACVVCVRACEG